MRETKLWPKDAYLTRNIGLSSITLGSTIIRPGQSETRRNIARRAGWALERTRIITIRDHDGTATIAK